MPPDEPATLNRAFAAVLKDPEVLARFKAFGSAPLITDPERVRRLHRQRDQEMDRGRPSGQSAAEVIIPNREEGAMPKLRHIAIATNDPKATAEFYKKAFGFEQIGETSPSSPLATGLFPERRHAQHRDPQVQDRPDRQGHGLHRGAPLRCPGRRSGEIHRATGIARRRTLHGQRQRATARASSRSSSGPDGTVFDIAGHPWMGIEAA